MENKQGLKNIASRSYFVLVEPIGRKVFFIGFLVIAIIALVLNAVITSLFGGIFVAGTVAFVVSCLVAIWYTKRFIDIKPKTNAKVFQVILFIFIFALNIFTYIQVGMTEELKAFSDYIVIHGLGAVGAPEVSTFTLTYGTPVSIARAIIGIPLLLFALFLFFKKGHETEIAREK